MNIRDLRQLRHFVAVAEELHFGRAAERLCMTQPPLSQSIQTLEQELGFELFNRTKRSVALTPVGALWLPYVRKLLADVQGLPDIAARLSRGEIGTVRLSFVSSAVFSVLPQLVGRYKEAFPEIELTLKEETSDLQIQGLLDNQIDAGIMITPSHRQLPPGIQYRPIQRDPLIAAVPASWVASGRVGPPEQLVDFSQICEAPLILYPRESAVPLYDLVTQYYEAQGRSVNWGQRAIQMQTIISLVSAGLGFSLVPSSMTNLERSGVVYRRLAGELPIMETGLVWHKNNAPPSVDHLIQLAVKKDWAQN